MAATFVIVWRLNQRTDNRVGSPAGLVLEGDVRVAISPRFTAFADPKTRLFWD
jgi:hypothetical protein